MLPGILPIHRYLGGCVQWIICLQSVNWDILAKLIQQLDIIVHKTITSPWMCEDTYAPTLVSGVRNRCRIIGLKCASDVHHEFSRRRFAESIAVFFQGINQSVWLF